MTPVLSAVELTKRFRDLTAVGNLSRRPGLAAAFLGDPELLCSTSPRTDSIPGACAGSWTSSGRSQRKGRAFAAEGTTAFVRERSGI